MSKLENNKIQILDELNTNSFPLNEEDINELQEFFLKSTNPTNSSETDVDMMIQKLKTQTQRYENYHKLFRIEQEKQCFIALLNLPKDYQFALEAQWALKYIRYLKGSSKQSIQKINNELIVKDGNFKTFSQKIVQKELNPYIWSYIQSFKMNCIPVNEFVWKFIKNLYGGGPEIIFSQFAKKQIRQPQSKSKNRSSSNKSKKQPMDIKIKTLLEDQQNLQREQYEQQQEQKLMQSLRQKEEEEKRKEKEKQEQIEQKEKKRLEDLQKIQEKIKNTTYKQRTDGSEVRKNKFLNVTFKEPEKDLPENQQNQNEVEYEKNEEKEQKKEPMKKNEQIQEKQEQEIDIEQQKKNSKKAKSVDLKKEEKEVNQVEQKKTNVMDEKKKSQSVISEKKPAIKQQLVSYQHLSTINGVDFDAVGLKNPRFYCYMNSALQCLMSISQLNAFFLSSDSKKGKYTKEFRELIQKANQSRGVLSADGMQKISQNKFSFNEQHDSHEYLLHLLSEMQDEIIGKQKSKEFKSAQDAWKHYCSTHNDIIDQIFAGQFTSRVQCRFCQKYSEAYDPLKDLSLPMNQSNRGEQDLNEILKEFFREESIDDEWKCESCKKKSRSVKKSLKISQTPNILIVQLKRFQIFPRKKKIEDSIKYPEQLDLKNYCTGDIVSTKYRLKAMILHSGSIDGGHYTAFGRRNNNVKLL